MRGIWVLESFCYNNRGYKTTQTQMTHLEVHSNVLNASQTHTGPDRTSLVVTRGLETGSTYFRFIPDLLRSGSKNVHGRQFFSSNKHTVMCHLPHCVGTCSKPSQKLVCTFDGNCMRVSWNVTTTGPLCHGRPHCSPDPHQGAQLRVGRVETAARAYHIHAI